ncbi:hypothetical protein T492DRAFT_1104775 [Pavlovales sp. CCMP2436]|nr:hypothetical protein T492DRAFT_1104775 [Pavlovales sp. CCMP2436]
MRRSLSWTSAPTRLAMSRRAHRGGPQGQRDGHPVGPRTRLLIRGPNAGGLAVQVWPPALTRRRSRAVRGSQLASVAWR